MLAYLALTLYSDYEKKNTWNECKEYKNNYGYGRVDKGMDENMYVRPTMLGLRLSTKLGTY